VLPGHKAVLRKTERELPILFHKSHRAVPTMLPPKIPGSWQLLMMWFDAAIRVYIDVIDVYLMQQAAEFAKLQKDLRQRDPMFYQKLADARRQRQTTQA
jgi:hypothetical protein